MNCLSGAIRRAVRLTRDGSWLTRSRLRLYPAIVLVMFVALLCVAVLDQIPAGTVFGGKGKPWSDFVSFWVPAKLAAEGRVAAIYDPVLMQSLQESIRGPLNTFQIWPYPPTYLVLILPLGLLSYWWAFALWESAGLAVYWLAFRRLVGREGLLLALTFPALWIAILFGHAEFMLAGLLAAALLRLEERPVTAGILIGCCAIKPHLFLLVPVALVAGAHWRAIGAACITIAATAALSLAILGLEPWIAFPREVTTIGGGIGAAEGSFYYSIATKQQSAFAYGGSIGGLKLGLLLHALVTLVAAIIVARVWQRDRALDTRAMVLCCGTLLASPYLFLYDLILLAVPIALVARRGVQDGFWPWEKSLLAALWMLPLIGLPATLYHLPLTPLLLALSLTCFSHGSSGNVSAWEAMPLNKPIAGE